MKAKQIVAFMIVSAIAFAGSAGYVAYRIDAAQGTRQRAIAASFRDLATAARSVIKSPPDATALSTWSIAAKDAYRRDSSLLLLAVHSSDGIHHMIPARSGYLAPPTADPAVRGPNYALPLSVKKLSTVVAESDAGIVVLDALYIGIGQRDVFDALAEGLVPISAWTAFSLALLIGTRAAERRRAREDIFGDDEPTTVAPFDEARETNPFGAVEDPADIEANVPEYVTTEAEPLHDDSVATPKNTEPFAGSCPDTWVSREPCDEEFSIPDIDADSGLAPIQLPPSQAVETPEGLYSEESGLGWEEYLVERLNAELSRSASFEQDLVLLVVAHDEFPRGHDAYRATSSLIREFFSFRDLAFEYGNAGFAVILPNIDLDHGMRMAEEFYKKVTFSLKTHRDPMTYLDMHIGLSSRSGRILAADRLILEACSALDKAKAEHDSHIMAFQSDPDKYRSFLVSRNLR